jgi:hypothetical protein
MSKKTFSTLLDSDPDCRPHICSSGLQNILLFWGCPLSRREFMPLDFTVAKIEDAVKKIEMQPNITAQDECVATALAAFVNDLTPSEAKLHETSPPAPTEPTTPPTPQKP